VLRNPYKSAEYKCNTSYLLQLEKKDEKRFRLLMMKVWRFFLYITPANSLSDIGKEAWLDIQKQFAETWKRLDPKAQVSLQPSVYDALELAKRVGDRGNGMQTFVTGSTRLVGPALDMLEGSTPDHQAK